MVNLVFFLPINPDFRSKQTSNKQFICCGLSSYLEYYRMLEIVP